MSTQILRNAAGNQIGRIEVSGSKLVIRDANGNLRGSYDPSSNTTRNSSGNIVGAGNLLTNLL